MIYRRERPKCRKFINEVFEVYGWSIQELYEFTCYDPEAVEWSPVFYITGGLKIQIHKMLEEGKINE